MSVAKDANMRRSLRATFTLALLAGFVPAGHAPCAADEPGQKGLQPCDPGMVGMDAAPLSQIPERMRQFVAEKQISGAVTLVARRGRIVHLANSVISIWESLSDHMPIFNTRLVEESGERMTGGFATAGRRDASMASRSCTS